MSIFPSPGNPATPVGDPPDSSTPQQQPPKWIPKLPPRVPSGKGDIVIVSRYGELAPLATRIGATLYLTHPWYQQRKLYDGLAPVVTSLKDALALKPAAILMDHTGDQDEKLGSLADVLRTRGFPVWGGGRAADLLETNRAFGIMVMVKAGITVPRTVFFDPDGGDPWQSVHLGDRKRIFRVHGHLADARAFVEAVGGRWVLKPHDTAASDLSYVAQSSEDLLRRLAHAEEMAELKPTQPFILQEFIKGVEISTEVWVQNGELIGVPNGTIETKKAFPGDLGPNSGCQTSVVWTYDSLRSPIVSHTVGRPELWEWLRQPTAPGGATLLPYSGPLDLNCIIAEDDHQAYGIEWTPRFGYSAIFALLELLGGDVRQHLIHLAQGLRPSLSAKPRYGYSLRVQIPPAPMADQFIPPGGKNAEERKRNTAFAARLMEDATHVHIGGPVSDEHVWLLDAQLNGAGLRTAGVDGAVMEITGSARRIEDARDATADLFDEIELQDKFARPRDGADRAIKDLARLHEWGFEVGPR